MKRQRTLTELKRLGDETFADAQATIDTAVRIAHNCRLLTAELRRTKAEFRRGQSLAFASKATAS